MAKDRANVEAVEVPPLDERMLACCILGTTPIFLNRMANKGLHEILFPSGRKTEAERAASLKHEPREEFRSSPYTVHDGPTFLAHLATSFKGAICNAAIDMPGATKAQVGRLLWVQGEYVPIYGIPKLDMRVVRSADMNHTPDVRSRCIVPEWASFIRISYVSPLLNQKTVGTLLSAAGIIQGVGDFRPGKGKGTFGQFKIVSPDDPDWQRITQGTSPKAQMDAMRAAEPYNEETAELLSWFDSEIVRRGVENRYAIRQKQIEEAESLEVQEAAHSTGEVGVISKARRCKKNGKPVGEATLQSNVGHESMGGY